MTLDPKYPAPPVVDGRPVVEPKQTPLVDGELVSGTIFTYQHIFGKDLDLRGAAAFAAQMILETGRIYCFWWDLGNVKASLSYRGLVQYYRCSEIIDGKEIHFDPYNPVACFRAWQTLLQGLEQHLRFLGTVTNSAGHPNRYQAAFDALVRGDVVGAVDELAKAGYFTANVGLYKSGMLKIFNQLMQTLPSVANLPVVGPHESMPEVMQPTSGRSPFSDADLKRIHALQIPLTIDWNEWREEVKRQSLEENLPQ